MVGNGKKRNRKIIIERTIAKDPSMVLFDPLVHLFFPKYVPIIAAYKTKKKICGNSRIHVNPSKNILKTMPSPNPTTTYPRWGIMDSTWSEKSDGI